MMLDHMSQLGNPDIVCKLSSAGESLLLYHVDGVLPTIIQLKIISVEAKLHGESKVIQRCFDDNNDDNKR